MICSKCNAPVKEGEKFCPGCGNDLSVDPPIQGEANNQVVNNEINDHSVEQPAVNNEQSVGTSANSVPVQDKVNIWLVILSWFIPLAGLIIFFVQKKSSPKTAKASGICALISALLSIIVTIACFALVFGTFNVVHKNAKEDMDTMIEDVLDKADQIMEEEEDQKDELEDEVNSGDTSSTTTPSDSTTTVTVDADWKKYLFSINNKTYALPMSYSDFKTATGFALKDTYVNMVLPNNHYAPVNLYKNDKLALYIELFNNSGLESKYVESKVTRVSQTKYQISQGADAIVFPGGLKVGDSVTDAQIITLFGQPNDLKDNGSSKQYTYLSDTTWTTTNNFKIKLVNGVIDEIQLDNRK